MKQTEKTTTKMIVGSYRSQYKTITALNTIGLIYSYLIDNIQVKQREENDTDTKKKRI